jgi:hypothetical protein
MPVTHRPFPRWKYSSVHLLGALVLLLVATPFIEDSHNGKYFEISLLTLVLVSAGLAAGGRRGVLLVSMVLLAPTVATFWTHHLFPGLISPAVHLSCTILFIGFIVFCILRFIMNASQVDTEVICAAISVYLLIGLLWSFLYQLLALGRPDAFQVHTDPSDPQTMTNFNALYFSYSSLSTLGFGDIIPVSKPARTLAFMEAMTGMFYVAILISRLVSLYVPQKLPPDTDRKS